MQKLAWVTRLALKTVCHVDHICVYILTCVTSLEGISRIFPLSEDNTEDGEDDDMLEPADELLLTKFLSLIT